MLNKILVAIDESASSEWAFDMALEMAKSLESSLLLVHVLDTFAPGSPKPPSMVIDSFLVDMQDAALAQYEQQWDQVTRRYDALLKEKQTAAESHSVTTTYLQAQGTPGQVICDIAKTNDVDLIVVGNRDRTNQKESAHSGISNYLVHHAPCAVTVVHPKADQDAISHSAYSEFVPVGLG